MIFGLAFWSLLPKEVTKKLFAALLLEPRLKLWGFAFFYFGASFLGALDSLGPRAETENKKTRLGPHSFGSRFLNVEV
jgi:hypothetical protein